MNAYKRLLMAMGPQKENLQRSIIYKSVQGDAILSPRSLYSVTLHNRYAQHCLMILFSLALTIVLSRAETSESRPCVQQWSTQDGNITGIHRSLATCTQEMNICSKI